ncbi:MAG TPA: RodZ domain-containing protein [Thermodesulfovibrionales bacterium]|nr:RodZ domain-containing protein [Thermodesulfovibrionales bacterium]
MKEKREELGVDLKEVAHTLRIQYEYLKALENNDFKKLPPDVYTRAYIREYARFLTIDPAILLDEYTKQQKGTNTAIQTEAPPAEKRPPYPLKIFFVPFSMIIIVILIIYFPRMGPVKKTEELPIAGNPPPVHEEAQVPPFHAGSGSKPNMLTVNAVETTWLRIEMEGGMSEEVLMKPGETKQWTSTNGFSIKVGNAGGVRLALNDRDMGIPGARGQVVKLTLP